MVAPILLTVGIAGSLIGATSTLDRTQQAAAASRVTAPVIVTPATGSGLADSTVTAIRSVPGVTGAVPVDDTKVYVNSGGGPDNWSARYVSGPALGGVLRLPVVAGDLAKLTGTGTIAVPAGSWRLGQTAVIWLDDSTPVRLRVVAVYADQIDLDQTVLLPWALRGTHSQAPVATAVYLRLSPGASLSALSRAAAAGGGTVIRTADYLSASDAQQNRTNNLALIAILGMALSYTGIAIANTLVMAAANRRRELATPRLAGATPAQVLRMIGVETGLVWFLAIVLAAAVTVGTVLGLRGGLRSAAPSVRLVIPWQPAGGIALACLLVALLASLIPAALALRHRPLDLVTAAE